MDAMSLIVRDERPGDIEAIRTVNDGAFGGTVEGRIVDLLRERNALRISLVAELNNQIVGHVAFSPVACEHGDQDALGLGPVAVDPPMQNQGIGSALIQAGLDRCRKTSAAFVVLLGDPAYYARFGFVPASEFHLRCKYHDGDAFQALELVKGALNDIRGMVHYDAAFDEAVAPE